jgi:hypothetical protein
VKKIKKPVDTLENIDFLFYSSDDFESSDEFESTHKLKFFQNFLRL